MPVKANVFPLITGVDCEALVLVVSQTNCITIMVSAEANKKRRSVIILSQNVRGIKSDDRLEELFMSISKRNCIAMCIQETWRPGKEVLENGQYSLVLSGMEAAQLQGKRGSQGVGIALSPEGVLAWKAAGSEEHTDLGARVMAVRLLLRDSCNKDVGVFIISAYAPVGTEDDDVWNSFFEKLDQCIARKRSNDVLVIGTDSNSSMGVSTDESTNIHICPRGKYGLGHINNSGRRFLSYLAVNHLTAITTHFEKRHYGTWLHPRSKKLHQIDHFLVNSEMFHRVMDAGITTPVLDSDHQAIKCRLRAMCRLKKKCDPHQRIANLDYSILQSSETKAKFCNEVVNQVNSLTPSSAPNYTQLALAVKNASTKTLPKKQRAQPGWFRANEQRLMSLIQARNTAMSNVFNRRTRQSTEKLRSARKSLKSAVSHAKNAWISKQCSTLSNANATHGGTKVAWDTVGRLCNGLSKTRPASIKAMKKPDGTTCTSPEENADVFRVHFGNLYGRVPVYDHTVLNLLQQLPIVNGCDHIPSDEEIKAATLKLRESAPGNSGHCSPVWKCLLHSVETFSFLKRFVVAFWENEEVPVEWETGLLKILLKNCDLSDPGNHRCIMLLETAYKVVAITAVQVTANSRKP